MILDCLENADKYAAMHPGFAAAFQFLRTADFANMPQGRNEIDGDRLHVMIGREPGQGREKRKLEFHQQYIDIQCVIAGSDEIGWRSSARCAAIDTPYDAKREVGFYADRPETYLELGPNDFVIFWPEDAHAPLSGRADMIKAVVKVAVDWK